MTPIFPKSISEVQYIYDVQIYISDVQIYISDVQIYISDVPSDNYFKRRTPALALALTLTLTLALALAEVWYCIADVVYRYGTSDIILHRFVSNGAPYLGAKRRWHSFAPEMSFHEINIVPCCAWAMFSASITSRSRLIARAGWLANQSS